MQKQFDRTYKMHPLSNYNIYLSAGDLSSTADQDVIVGSAQTDGSDTWKLYEVYDNVHLESQQQRRWCWVACARMMSFKYINPSISQASAAVHVKLGIDASSPTAQQITSANQTGTFADLEEAIQYLFETDITYIYYSENSIYDESTLRSILDESPVCIGRSYYTDEGGYLFGHMMVICDYHWDSSANTYLYEILDPGSVNTDSPYFVSYQWILNGQNALENIDVADNGRWSGVFSYKATGYNNIISINNT